MHRFLFKCYLEHHIYQKLISRLSKFCHFHIDSFGQIFHQLFDLFLKLPTVNDVLMRAAEIDSSKKKKRHSSGPSNSKITVENHSTSVSIQPNVPNMPSNSDAAVVNRSILMPKPPNASSMSSSIQIGPSDSDVTVGKLDLIQVQLNDLPSSSQSVGQSGVLRRTYLPSPTQKPQSNYASKIMLQKPK